MVIIETSGKQYCVNEGQQLTVDRLDAAIGDTVRFSDILTGQALTAEVVEHILGDKVMTRKFRNKTRYQRVRGHRQAQTVLRIKGAETTTVKKAAAKAESKV